MSEVIITREMREDAKKCGQGMSCDKCRMRSIIGPKCSSCVEALASSPGVFDEAPENADIAEVRWWEGNTATIIYKKDYTRALPKSLDQELVEKYSELLEAMLKEYAERKGK